MRPLAIALFRKRPCNQMGAGVRGGYANNAVRLLSMPGNGLGVNAWGQRRQFHLGGRGAGPRFVAIWAFPVGGPAKLTQVPA